MTSQGKTCKDIGLLAIGAVDECIENIGHIQAEYPGLEFKNEETAWDYPKGCYAYVANNSDFGIYFNTHQSGFYEDDSVALCHNDAPGKKSK